MIEVYREFAGVRLVGPHYAIRLHLVTESAETLNASTVNVDVLALPAVTECDCDVRLETETVAHDFALADITVDCGELRCLRAPYDRAAYFREGFTLVLEAGMAEQLATHLPRIERVSVVVALVQDAVQRALERAPWPHERSAIADVVANAVLDASAPAAAMAFAMGLSGRCEFSETEGNDPQYAELGSALRTLEVVAVLKAAAREGAA
ncbi:hypothetical protein DF112_35795 [Burkholderia stagnalis]|uniref:hypothetical protein n=1 Tax=Burkholderia stagnalis TaxID=1503054 RepID=UPI000F6008BD|nr:hypothetical protein [Burkholderia stagnalis]RQX88331.1 hypothetical protein DF119_31820 [Burkholderia stagnalis]RQY33372.1 hypothetical protein DF116_25035 [Burkholderia stagnalis]RQY39960.1 hypothetical protein DF112_35795 [Burkholderia stagnalis]RQY56681.1 hypothetical protein DF111_12875 [Burkholderia stagnalis]RQY86456.1 hypothetical protein DF108_12690 [Burkholderia stagnalis]